MKSRCNVLNVHTGLKHSTFWKRMADSASHQSPPILIVFPSTPTAAKPLHEAPFSVNHHEQSGSFGHHRFLELFQHSHFVAQAGHNAHHFRWSIPPSTTFPKSRVPAIPHPGWTFKKQFRPTVSLASREAGYVIRHPLVWTMLRYPKVPLRQYSIVQSAWTCALCLASFCLMAHTCSDAPLVPLSARSARTSACILQKAFKTYQATHIHYLIRRKSWDDLLAY